MECPATPPNIADCEMLRTPSPSKHDELGTSHNKTAQNKSIHGTDEDDKDKKEGSDTQAKDDGRCRSPDPTCAICLGQIENMSYTDSCFHKFCFTCLLEWSKVRPVCPLCKARFKSIIHTIQSDNVYESYTLPPPPTNNSDNVQASRQEMALFLEEIQRFRQNLSQQFRSGLASLHSDWRQSNSRQQNQPPAEQAAIDSIPPQVLPSLPPFRFPSRTTSAGPLWNRRRGVATSAFRRNIYRQNLYVEADSIVDITGRVRECNADWYRNNQAQTHRLVPWLNRELNALMEAQIHQVPYVLQLILDLIQRFNIQSPEFHEQMMPYTGTRTNHFQHEFYNFARSTYDMIGYDRHAMYTDIHPMNPVTYVVSSDSSSSSSDENDIQVEQTSSTYSSASQQNQDNNELIVVDDSTPQTTTSADQKNNGANEEPVASTSSGQTIQNDETPFPLIISSGESDINESNKDNDVEIVNYVKPRKDRTPVIVNIDSSGDDKIKKEKVTSSTSAYNSLPSKSEESSTHSAFTSSLIALSPPASTTSPAIVVIDDSSPENRNVESEYRANRSDKPLWMRNFENCFPNAAETSDKIKKSKCQNEPTRKKLKSNKTRKRFSSPASSSTDSDVDQPNLKKRSKLQTPRNNKKDVRDIRKTISSPLNSSESSSTLGEDDGGWFQSGDNSDNTANCRKMNKKEDKGKGKGKGKSSQNRNEQEVDKAGCSNMRLELKLNQKNVKSINSEEKVCEKNGRRNLIDSNTDSEDRPLTHKRRRDVKHRRKGNENNLIKHVKQSVFNDRNKDDYNSKDMSLKQSKSRIRDSVQITTNTKVSDDFSSTKMAQEMENWKNANGIQKEFSANDRRDLKSAKAKGDKSITSREETSVETDPIVKKSLKRATNIFDSDSSNSVSSDETKNNSKHEEQLIQISSVKRKDYFLKKNLIHKTRKSKVLSSSSDDDVSSQTLLKCKERDSSVRLKHKCKSKRKDTNKIHDSNNTSPSVKSMVVKIDSNKVIKECVGGAITTSGQIDSDAISEDLRIKLNQKKKQKAKNLVKGNTNKGNFIEQRSIRLPTNDNDGQVNNPERILITSTLNNENCENVNERIVTVEHLPNLEEN